MARTIGGGAPPTVLGRILLDPDPAGQSTGGTPTADPDQGQSSPPGDRVTLSSDEYRALQEAARVGAEGRQTMAQRLESLETQYRAEKVNSELGNALANRQFASDAAAAQVRQLLAARAELRQVNGVPTVVDRVSGRPLAEAAREALASEEFAHFLAAATRGGSGVTNAPLGYGVERPPARYSVIGDDYAAPPDKLGGGLGIRRPPGA